ncbi:MAG: FAD-binding oxidoreductase [Burkholderia sp.]
MGTARCAGSVQPLAYARGLARAAQRAGAILHGGSPCSAWSARAAAGTCARRRAQGRHDPRRPGADRDQWLYRRPVAGAAAESIIAANSFIVATAPLPEQISRGILPGGEVASDSRRLLLYFRKDASGRLLMGGRGPFSEPGAAADWAHLERAATLMFRQLRGIGYDYRWAGRIAITRDFLPHLHRPAPGLTIALGYNGRGIALATTLGRHLADAIDGSAPELPPAPIRPIPLHALQRLYISAGVAWYALLDALS